MVRSGIEKYTFAQKNMYPILNSKRDWLLFLCDVVVKAFITKSLPQNLTFLISFKINIKIIYNFKKAKHIYILNTFRIEDCENRKSLNLRVYETTIFKSDSVRFDKGGLRVHYSIYYRWCFLYIELTVRLERTSWRERTFCGRFCEKPDILVTFCPVSSLCTSFFLV